MLWIFLAILVPVDGSEIRQNTTPQYKIGTNTPQQAPEMVHFL